MFARFVFLAVATVLGYSPFASLAVDKASLPRGIVRIQTVEGITEYRLINGLKVLLAPDDANERVTVNLTYMVGSRHEGYGEAGMAHLLEHLLFKGTPTTPDPKSEFRKRGFAFNGTTTEDRTNYFASFVSTPEALKWYLSWQADAMVHSFVSAKDLKSEMSVVRNEFEIQEGNPVQVLVGRMGAVSYQWHSYRRPVIGARSDIENVDIESLRTFYRRYYRPDNAVLVVAGKFSVADAVAAIASTLGQVAKPATVIPQPYTREPEQDGERSIVVRRPATTQVLLASYRTPPALHPDSEPLAILSSVIGSEPSGRLHKTLVQTKLAQGVFAVPMTRKEGGNLIAGVVFAPGDDAEERKRLLLEVLEDIANHPVTQEEFERAKNQLNARLEQGFADAAAVADGAIEMEVAGDWRAVFVGRERVKAVTLDDVNRVARTYLIRDNRTLGLLIPTEEPKRAPVVQSADVEGYMAGYPLKEESAESSAFDYSPSSLYDRMHSSADAGLKIVTLEKPVRGDMVHGVLKIKFGNREALLHQEAAASMAASMLVRGTARYTRQQLSDELVKLGASVNFAFGAVGGTMSVVAKKENFRPALELAVHMLKEPAMPEAEFDEARSAWIKSLQGKIQDRTAQDHNAWLRYDNPYAPDDFRHLLSLEE